MTNQRKVTQNNSVIVGNREQIQLTTLGTIEELATRKNRKV